MSALIGRLALVALIALATAVRADSHDSRVVLADADPELRRAIEAALAPWHLEVVVDAVPPLDTSAALDRAKAQSARFVVWRRDGDLVVFDRERGDVERREARSGALDPVSAAAAALTVKTLMRLPPPAIALADPAGDPTSPAMGDVAPPVDQPIDPSVDQVRARSVLRVHAGLATRISRGSETAIGARVGGGVMVQPSSQLGLRLGLAGEIGPASDIQHAGFKGTWSDWSVLGLVSWTFANHRMDRSRWEIEPHVGVGITRSNVDGIDAMDARFERDSLVLARGGVWLRYRVGAVSVGATLGVDFVANTPTYTRSNNGPEFFEVPPLALALGVMFAADLSR